MRPKGTKAPAVPPPVEVALSDREMLIGAFKSGLIVGWKRESEQSYRLTLRGQGDTFVEVAKLTRYLEGLPARSAPDARPSATRSRA